MKHIITLTAVFLTSVAFQTNAFALPPWKQGSPLHKKQKQLEQTTSNSSGKLVLVCKDSKGIVLIPVKDRQEAIEICTSGTISQKNDCRKRYRIVWHNPARKSGSPRRVLEVIDSDGRDCLTLARIKWRLIKWRIWCRHLNYCGWRRPESNSGRRIYRHIIPIQNLEARLPHFNH